MPIIRFCNNSYLIANENLNTANVWYFMLKLHFVPPIKLGDDCSVAVLSLQFSLKFSCMPRPVLTSPLLELLVWLLSPLMQSRCLSFLYFSFLLMRRYAALIHVRRMHARKLCSHLVRICGKGQIGQSIIQRTLAKGLYRTREFRKHTHKRYNSIFARI